MRSSKPSAPASSAILAIASSRSRRTKRGGEGARARLLHQQRRLALLGDAKPRRDIGLEREEMQQALAEGVDRLDLQAARRLDGAREQAAREAEPGGVGRRRAGLDDCAR